MQLQLVAALLACAPHARQLQRQTRRVQAGVGGGGFDP